MPPMRPSAPPLEEDGDKVQLKPILGIRPGVYLSVLYGLLILVVLFFLVVFPGLSKPGSVLSVNTVPQGAAIRIDGVNRGSSPEKLFVERGVHTVELVLPGFESRSLELDVPSRALFSLFFPRRLDLRETLNTQDPLALIAASAADYAAWSFTGEATSAYQIPLSFSEGVYRGAFSLEKGQEAAELIPAAARFAVSQASLRDLSRAKLLLDNRGLSPSPLSLVDSAGDILSWLSTAPGAAAWLAGILPAESAALVKGSAWYAAAAEAARPAVGDYSTGLPASLQIAGLRFNRVGALYAMEDLVQSSAWDAFVRARPEWAAGNINGLREQGLVNGDYLLTPENSRLGAAQTGISWHGAQAFCQWLQEQLPPGFEAGEIRLPREDEWEYLAQTSGWEWCDDPYAPIRSFPAASWAVQAVSSPERLLRGGPRPEIRGSLPPDFCSPFVGFRPIFVPEAGK